MDGHSPTNAFGKNNGTEAQVATDGDPDLSNDLVPNNDPQTGSSLCEYPGPGYSSCAQCVLGYSLTEYEQALSSSDPCTSQELFYSFEQCSLDCSN